MQPAQDELFTTPWDAVLSWQQGQTTRDHVIRLLSRIPDDQGEQVQRVVRALCQQWQDAPAGRSAEDERQDTPAWREELMSSRAKAWAVPHPAGLLVGPEALILTDGQQGALLREGTVRCLPASVCGSLLLLCQTIVMAQSAVNAQELQQLQRQRIESTSTSLSAITPVE